MSTAPDISQATPRNRRAQTFATIAIAKNGDTTDVAAVIPVTAGSGAPNHNAHVAGEIYIRTDGTAAAGTILYVATDTSGTWTPLLNLGALAPTVLSLTDNTATALDIKEGSNSYLKFTTTNSAEKVTISKALALLAGLDLSGAASTVSLIDNTAAALDITEGANTYIRCVTTNGSESVAFGKPVLFGGGLAPGSIFKSTEQTGNASPQNIAHGLGTTPSLVWVTVTEDPAGTGFDVAEGTHDATNCVVTVTNGVKYKVLAFK